LPEEPAMVKLSMTEIERTAAAVDGPVVSEGGRCPSTLSPGQRDASQGGTPPAANRPGPLAPGRRWSAGRKREVVLRLLRGEAAELLSRELAVPVYKLEQWRAKAEVALDGALKDRAGEPANLELAAAMQRIGELSMENELLRSRIERPGPLARRRSR
jgi:transposase